jgi:hypothetical protein
MTMQNLHSELFRDKVLGCWTGKNIGGTLGTPFEGSREMNDVTFYRQNLAGAPAPNDDLDLQLVWLQAAEENGVDRLTPRLLGEYWVNFITGPWNEYSVGKLNIRNGLYPPLSGSCNNERWKNSNGAWIRSEIWACLFPGSPDEAIRFAYMDACADHAGEGVYAEIFTAAIESAAFIVADIRMLIDIGLAKIPDDSKLAQTIRLARELYDQKADFRAARDQIVEFNADFGWFQAPANLGFVVLALLYGEGDFGRSVTLAVNCGDDTDCTGATVGALLGIIMGRSAIPPEWIAPIGESILTVAISKHGMQAPETLAELTDRVIRLARTTAAANPALFAISEAPTAVTDRHLQTLVDGAPAAALRRQSPFELVFDLPFMELAVDYDHGPAVRPGEAKKLTIRCRNCRFAEENVHLRWLTPADWRVLPGAAVVVMAKKYLGSVRLEQTVVPGEFEEAFYYLPLEVRLGSRTHPVTLQIPFQKEGCVVYDQLTPDPDELAALSRLERARLSGR